MINKIKKIILKIFYNLQGYSYNYFSFPINNKKYYLKGTKNDEKLIAGWKKNKENGSEVIIFNLIEKLKKNPVIFDVGANIGKYSIYFSTISNSIVYSFEPVKPTFKVLYTNVKRNRIKNIFPINLGLSSKKNKVLIGVPDKDQGSVYGKKNNSGLSSIYANEKSKKRELIELITLDDFIESEKIEKLDYIKIDVEGHELEVLKGGGEILKKYKPIIQMEVNSQSLKLASVKLDDLFNFLYKLNYKSYYFKNKKLISVSIKDFNNSDMFKTKYQKYNKDVVFIND